MKIHCYSLKLFILLNQQGELDGQSFIQIVKSMLPWARPWRGKVGLKCSNLKVFKKMYKNSIHP